LCMNQDDKIVNRHCGLDQGGEMCP
jgi:hypothetical protein